MWRCIQTLEFQSSGAAEGKYENAIFNNLVVASNASLILLANAKKNSIYAIHVEFGRNPAAARMNYLAEFSVTMPILSLTVTEETGTRDGKVQIYCVQTQAIQQYELDVSQCLPPPTEVPDSVSPSPEKLTVLPLHQECIGLASGENVASDVIDMIPLPSSDASNATMTGSNVIVPSKGIHGVPSAFGSPVEVGEREVSSGNNMEKCVGVDFAKFLQGPADNISGLPPGTQSMNTPNLESINRSEAAPSASHTKLPTSNQNAARSRSRSPIKGQDVQYISMRSMSAKPEDIVESRPESSSLVPALNVSTLDRGQSSSSSNSVEENVDRLDVSSDTGSAKSQQGGHQGLHLITPSELMNLAASSKHTEIYSAPTLGAGQQQDAKDGKTQGPNGGTKIEGLMALDSIVVLEKEVCELQSLSRANGSIKKDDVVSSSTQSLETVRLSKDHPESDLAGHHKNKSKSGFLCDMYMEEETLQGEEGQVLEDEDRSMNELADDNNEQLPDPSVRDGVTEALPLPPQSSAIVKGRRNKNKTNVGGVGPTYVPLPSQMAIMSTSGSKTDGESSQSVKSAPQPATTITSTPGSIDPVLLAQVASMQESLNQVCFFQSCNRYCHITSRLQYQETCFLCFPGYSSCCSLCVVTHSGCRCWFGVAAAGYHAEGNPKANDSNGGCACCKGGQTDGRYIHLTGY